MLYTNVIILQLKKEWTTIAIFRISRSSWLYSALFLRSSSKSVQYIITRKLDWKLMTSTGSRRAPIQPLPALTTAIAFEAGLDSPLFAVSAIFTVIVMFDATGIRFQAGQHAVIINQMRIDFQTFVQEARVAG